MNADYSGWKHNKKNKSKQSVLMLITIQLA